jgi:hypothetical protein
VKNKLKTNSILSAKSANQSEKTGIRIQESGFRNRTSSSPELGPGGGIAGAMNMEQGTGNREEGTEGREEGTGDNGHGSCLAADTP